MDSDPLYAAASAVWQSTATGFLNNVTAMLRGRSKTGQWEVCNLEAPLDAESLIAWAAWYRKTNPKLNLPEKPDTIQKWVCKFQQLKVVREARAQRQGNRILDMSDVAEDDPDYFRIQTERMRKLEGWAS